MPRSRVWRVAERLFHAAGPRSTAGLESKAVHLLRTLGRRTPKEFGKVALLLGESRRRKPGHGGLFGYAGKIWRLRSAVMLRLSDLWSLSHAKRLSSRATLAQMLRRRTGMRRYFLEVA